MIYCFVKPTHPLDGFETALAVSAAELQRYCAPFEMIMQEIKDWVKNNNFSLVCTFGEFLCIEFPMEKVSELSEFLKRSEYGTKTCLSVGIGLNPLEAFKAMLMSDNLNGERVVLYSEDIENALLDDELSKVEVLVKNDSYGLEFPDSDLFKEEPPQENLPQQEKLQNDHKQKLIEALSTVKANSKIFLQLKESAPEAFKAVKVLIDALIAMSQNKG